MKNHIRNALLLGAVTMFLSLPMFHYQFRHLTGEVFRGQPTVEMAWRLALSQSFMVFCLAFMSSLIGFIYAEKLRLPGLGKAADIRVWLPGGLAAGLIFTPISYILLDREVIRLIPGIHPSSLSWTLPVMLAGAFCQEVIIRFGLLTIALYLWNRWTEKGRPWPAIALISAFGATGSWLLISRLGIAGGLSHSQIMTMVVLSFLTQWILGEVYVKKGLSASICVHLGLSAKYLVFTALH